MLDILPLCKLVVILNKYNGKNNQNKHFASLFNHIITSINS